MTNPMQDPDLDTPDKLRAFALEALKQSRTMTWAPVPVTPPPVMPNTMYQPPLQQADHRLTGVVMLMQGMLAMQIAESITHVIEEEP